MSAKKQASLTAFFGGGASASDKAKPDAGKKQASITGFFGGGVEKPSGDKPAKASDETAAPASEKQAESTGKRRKPNTVVDDDDAAASGAAAATEVAAAAMTSSATAAAAAVESKAPPAESEHVSAASSSGDGASSGPAGAAAAVAAAAASAASAAATAPQAVDAGGWQAVPDTAALFKRASPGYHPLRDVDWKTTLLALGNASERSAAASAAFFGGASTGNDGAAGTAAAAAAAAAPPVGALKVECAPLPYAALVRVFSEVEKTTKRLEITAALTNFLRSVIVTSPQDLLPCLYLCTNTLAPPYENLELGVGDSLLMKALSEATGRQLKDVKAAADEKGDLGLVAETSRAAQRTLFSSMGAKPAAAPAAATAAAGGAGSGAGSAAAPSGMSVRQVYTLFLSIARESGKSSQEKKVAAIKRLLVNSSGVEAKYIIRSMQGKLRIGLAKQTVLVALAHAFALSGPAVSTVADAEAAAALVGGGGAAAGAAAASDAAAAAGSAEAAMDEASDSESVSSSGSSDSAGNGDDDDDVLPAGKRGAGAAAKGKANGKGTGKGKGAAAAAVGSKRKAGAMANGNGKGEDADGDSDAEAAAVTDAAPSASVAALGPAVLAALSAMPGVRIEEFTLPAKTLRAVAAPVSRVPAGQLVYRHPNGPDVGHALPPPPAGKAAAAAAAAAASASAPAAFALPPAVVDWRQALGLAGERYAARAEAAVTVVKQVYSELPSYDALVPALLREGLSGALRACALTPGVPVAPMLAKPTHGVREVLDRFTGVHFTCEYKYDGERAQVHVTPSGAVSIFSRNSENTTGKFPDIAATMREVIALGPNTPATAAAATYANPPVPVGGEPAAAAADAGSSATAAVGADAGAGSEASAMATDSQPATASAGGAGAGAGAASAAVGSDSSSGAVAFASGPAEVAAAIATLEAHGVSLPHVTSCVIDGEAVAYDREKGCLMPFQVLSTRARKDVTVDTVKVQVVYAAFDLLLVNGISLLHVPLRTRRALLRLLFREVPGKFVFATSYDSADVDEISAFLNDAVKGGCEGLMVKVLDGAGAVYEPSKRSLNWLKLKKDYMDGLTDSFDLVPIAAWKGKGKRTGVYGAYLLACYDPEEEVYQAITRIGTGFSDEMLQELTTAMNGKAGCASPNVPKNVIVSDALLDADVWFDPDSSEVWEVMAADLSISPVHKAALGKVDPAKGIALRFPRFIRRRDDKGPSDATSASQVAAMYRSQSTVKSTAADFDDDD